MSKLQMTLVVSFLLLPSGWQLGTPCTRTMNDFVSRHGCMSKTRPMVVPVTTTLIAKPLALRGGSDDGEASIILPRQTSSQVVLVPDDTADLQDAVHIAEQRAALDQQPPVGVPTMAGQQLREIRVGASIPDESREWGTQDDGFKKITIRGPISLRMDDSVSLMGPIDLQPSSRGMFTRWKWGCTFSLRLPQPAALVVAGGPWHIHRSLLRATDLPVICAHGNSILSLHDCLIGGFSPLTSHEEALEADEEVHKIDADEEEGGRCTQALQAEGNASVTATDCTLQYCGAWRCASVVAGGTAHVSLKQCFLFQNLGCGLSIHEAANVQMSQCSRMQSQSACFRAVLAQRARLRVTNFTFQGPKWHDCERPGIVEEEASVVVEAKRRRLHPPELDAQAAVLTRMDKDAESIVRLWEALTQELAANSTEVIEALESYCNSTLGATCRRARTGVLTYADEDLPPLLLADFSHLAHETAKTTVCVYVHVDPLILSALRDPDLIADGQALLIEHSDRFLSRRRFGGDASRIVVWLAALQAFSREGRKTGVRVKMLFDFLEEAHCELLGKRLAALSRGADAFLRAVDYVCVMHGEWLTPWQPCLITSFRGLATHFITVSAPWQDLHSGTYGGGVREPYADLVAILAQLTAGNGSVSVPGISSPPLSADEMQCLRKVTFLDDAAELPPGWEAFPLPPPPPAPPPPMAPAPPASDSLRPPLPPSFASPTVLQPLPLTPAMACSTSCLNNGRHDNDGSEVRAPNACQAKVQLSAVVDAALAPHTLHEAQLVQGPHDAQVVQVVDARAPLNPDTLAPETPEDETVAASPGTAAEAEATEAWVGALGRTWLRPSLSVHGISGGWTQPGCRTVIPARVEAKVSVRFPPGLTAAEVSQLLQTHVQTLAQRLGTQNKVEVRMQYGWEAWSADSSSPFYEEAAAAMVRVLNVEPDFIHDGGSLHVTRLFQEACVGSHVGVLSLSYRDATRFSDDSLRVTSDYMLLGAKTVVAFLDQLAHAE